MMVAMMLPSLVPMLWHYHQAVGRTGETRFGLHCSYCCAGLTAILLVIEVMDQRVMAVVTAAITVERLAPAGERVGRAIVAVVVGAGLFLIARAAGQSAYHLLCRLLRRTRPGLGSDRRRRERSASTGRRVPREGRFECRLAGLEQPGGHQAMERCFGRLARDQKRCRFA